MLKDACPKIVLIVDDDPLVVNVIKGQLEFDGYAALGVDTGKAACETVENTKLFVVLLDLGLGDMDGFTVLQKIKELKPDLPVIIVTGNHQETEGRRAFELGAWDYLTKPIDFKYLKNILLLQSQV
jgi:DNA-binding response OmpR family regulator